MWSGLAQNNWRWEDPQRLTLPGRVQTRKAGKKQGHATELWGQLGVKVRTVLDWVEAWGGRCQEAPAYSGHLGLSAWCSPAYVWNMLLGFLHVADSAA